MRNHKFNAVNKSSILSKVAYQNKEIWQLNNLNTTGETGSTGDTETKQNSIVVTNSTWSPTKLMRSYTARVKTIADTLNPPTFTSSNGTIRDLELGEVLNSNVSEDALFDITPVFTANTGDELIISYTTY